MWGNTWQDKQSAVHVDEVQTETVLSFNRTGFMDFFLDRGRGHYTLPSFTFLAAVKLIWTVCYWLGACICTLSGPSDRYPKSPQSILGTSPYQLVSHTLPAQETPITVGMKLGVWQVHCTIIDEDFGDWTNVTAGSWADWDSLSVLIFIYLQSTLYDNGYDK